MGLLKPLEQDIKYLKAGFLGFEKSGKTTTATLLAIGLCKRISAQTIAYFDTENGAPFMKPKIEKAGLEAFVYKGRTFADLLAFVRECEKEQIGVVIIDSVSAVWKELCTAYKNRLRRKNGFYIQDWQAIKQEWGQFSDLYVNSPLNIILCGRAAYEYDTVVNDDTGRSEMTKSGTKMRVESELGYEPSLLIEMERTQQPGGGKLTRNAIVKGDRTDLLDGKEFVNPTYENFKPHVEFILRSTGFSSVDTTRNSEDMFEDVGRSSSERKRLHAILLEKLQEALVLGDLDGRSNEAQKKRTELLLEVFGTSSKTAIESLSVEKLREGVDRVRERLSLPPGAPGSAQEDKEPVTAGATSTTDLFSE